MSRFQSILLWLLGNTTLWLCCFLHAHCEPPGRLGSEVLSLGSPGGPCLFLRAPELHSLFHSLCSSAKHACTHAHAWVYMYKQVNSVTQLCTDKSHMCHTHIHIHVHIHVFTGTHAHMHSGTYARTCIQSARAHICTLKHTHRQAHIMHMHTLKHIQTHVCAHMYPESYMHMHTHTSAHVSASLCRALVW